MSKGKISIGEDGKISLGELEGALELSTVVERRVNALMNLHDQYLEINKKYQEEVRALERKYQDLYDPLYNKRESIVNGKYEPTDEEAKYGEEEEEKKEDKPKGDEKGVPDFWSHVLQNSDFIAQTIQEQDMEALEFLTDIRCNNFETTDTVGFELVFHFAENPYFTNKTLSKKYFLEIDEMFGEFELDHAEGCKIDWKSGKDLSVKAVKKKSKAKKGKKAAAPKTVTVMEPCETFFNFFSPPQADDKDEEEEEDEDEEFGAQDEKEQMIQVDFDIGCKIKDMIPVAVLWFTGDAAEFDDNFADFDQFGGEDDDEEDEEDDEEEEEEPKRGGRGGKGGAPKGGKGHEFQPPKGSNIPQPQQPECKQQ